jgi:hypothetical protein
MCYDALSGRYPGQAVDGAALSTKAVDRRYFGGLWEAVGPPRGHVHLCADLLRSGEAAHRGDLDKGRGEQRIVQVRQGAAVAVPPPMEHGIGVW